MGSRTILISPHLDDAALSCALQLRAGSVSSVVTVFTAAPDSNTHPTEWDAITRAPDPVLRSQQRRDEDAAAWASIGQHFGHLSCSEDDNQLDVQALTTILESKLHLFDRILAPAGIGGHPGHTLVRDASLAAAAYCGMIDSIILYGELPYCAFFGWPQPNDTHLDVEAYWQYGLRTASSDDVRWAPTLRRLSDDDVEWKLRLLLHYPTQLRALGGGSLDMFRKTDLLSHELEFVRVCPKEFQRRQANAAGYE